MDVVTLSDGKTYRLDLIPGGRDVRDFAYRWLPPADAPESPPSLDLEPGFGPIFDQGHEGSCTGNAYAGQFEFMQRTDGVVEFHPPSRSFAYWVGRKAANFPTGQDTGTTIRGVVAGGVQYGICPEAEMPYVDGGFATSPTARQFADALPNKPLAYRSVSQDISTLKACLVANKPVIFGFAVYQSISATGPDGLVPPPSGQLLGYHANVLMGYDDATQRVKSRNSWGASWGRHGYGFFRYVDIFDPNFAFDWWVLDRVAGPTPVPPGPPNEAQLWDALLKMHASAVDPINLAYRSTNDIGQYQVWVKYGRDRHDAEPPQLIAVDIPG